MVKKFIFLTCCLITGHLTAYENELSEKMSQNVDRYQIQVVTNKDGYRTQIYLLDKENGTIWAIMNTGYSNFDFCPWVKLPPLPPMQESE
jgi:hypothetical protein